MRRIILSDTESALFDEEMVPGDYEFLNRHKDTFCRMWTEQVCMVIYGTINFKTVISLDEGTVK